MVAFLRVLASHLCVLAVRVAASDSDTDVCSSTHCSDPQDVAHEGSLLQAFAKARSKAQMLSDQVRKHQAWRAEHDRISHEMYESKDSLDDFIQEQKESSDHCSARLFEAKRTLDGLLKDLKAISDEASSHETILETETENLNVTHMSIEAVEIQYEEEIDKCEDEKKDAHKEVHQYEAELEELNQIAKPEVRLKTVERPGIVEKSGKSKDLEDALDAAVEAALGKDDNGPEKGELKKAFPDAPPKEEEAPKVVVNEPVAAPMSAPVENPGQPIIMTPERQSNESGQGVAPISNSDSAKDNAPLTSPIMDDVPVLQPSLLQTGAFTKDKCLAFLDFQKRHHHRHHHKDQKQVPESEVEQQRVCDEQRKKLQDAFTEAYKEVKDLVEAAKDRVRDIDDCYDAAKARKSGEEVPLVAQRETATGRIEQSAAALAALEPVIHLVDDRAERLHDHIKEDLTPECKEADQVSETLQRVRELIQNLERCPGSDFRLQIPTEEDEDDEDENKASMLQASMLSSKHALPPAQHSKQSKHSHHLQHPKRSKAVANHKRHHRHK